MGAPVGMIKDSRASPSCQFGPLGLELFAELLYEWKSILPDGVFGMMHGIPFEHFQSLIDAFLRTVREDPDQTFLRMRQGGDFVSFSYRETRDRVERIGAYLKKSGFSPGERAAVVGANSPEWVLSYLGILWAGGGGGASGCQGFGGGMGPLDEAFGGEVSFRRAGLPRGLILSGHLWAGGVVVPLDDRGSAANGPT
jgi:hypothetical protein